MVDPKHKYVFEIFFFLGETRNLTKLSRIQMTKLYPNIEPDTDEYKRKFNSVYKKYQRWASTENWHEEAQRREESDRAHRTNIVRNEEETLSNTVQLYRKMVRYMLQEFAEKVVQKKVEVKSIKEAKQMIELDMYLSQIIDRRPKALSVQVLEMMTEKERRGADKVFEWLHKRATRESAIEDLGDVVEAEQVLDEHAQTQRLLTPAPEKPEKAPVVQNLEEAEAMEKKRANKELVRKRRLERLKRLLEDPGKEFREEEFTGDNIELEPDIDREIDIEDRDIDREKKLDIDRRDIEKDRDKGAKKVSSVLDSILKNNQGEFVDDDDDD
jgi:hypothetical protein